MQRVLFYLPKGSVFEATEHYTKIIAKSFINRKYDVFITDKLDELKNTDYLITIRPNDPVNLKIKPKKIIHWFQGIGPEERRLNDDSLRARISELRYKRWERFILKKGDLLLFVSDRMKQHYQEKYKVNVEDKSIIMPCYNIELNKNSFLNTERYTNNKFVYAGGLHDWQCINEMLSIFNQFLLKDKKSTLTILTKDQKVAKTIIEKNQYKNVFVNYVSLNDLQEELSKYKYGFLLRKDHIINNVSTPTKMNSYLSAGVIPIYTPVVDAFEKNIYLDNYCVKIKDLTNIYLASEIIFEHSQIKIKKEDIFNTYENVFSTYYNDDYYIDLMEQKVTVL